MKLVFLKKQQHQFKNYQKITFLLLKDGKNMHNNILKKKKIKQIMNPHFNQASMKSLEH
jgi:hypothetical protein